MHLCEIVPSYNCDERVCSGIPPRLALQLHIGLKVQDRPSEAIWRVNLGNNNTAIKNCLDPSLVTFVFDNAMQPDKNSPKAWYNLYEFLIGVL